MNLFNLKPKRKGNEVIILEKRRKFAIVKDLKDKTYVYFVYNPFVEEYSYIETKKKYRILSPITLYIGHCFFMFLFYLFLIIRLPIEYCWGCMRFIKGECYNATFFNWVNFIAVIVLSLMLIFK